MSLWLNDKVEKTSLIASDGIDDETGSGQPPDNALYKYRGLSDYRLHSTFCCRVIKLSHTLVCVCVLTAYSFRCYVTRIKCDAGGLMSCLNQLRRRVQAVGLQQEKGPLFY